MCGRHSLHVFCLGVLLAFAGHVAIVEISSTTSMQVLVSAIGIAAMVAIAELMTWYRATEVWVRRCWSDQTSSSSHLHEPIPSGLTELGQ